LPSLPPKPGIWYCLPYILQVLLKPCDRIVDVFPPLPTKPNKAAAVQCTGWHYFAKSCSHANAERDAWAALEILVAYPSHSQLDPRRKNPPDRLHDPDRRRVRYDSPWINRCPNLYRQGVRFVRTALAHVQYPNHYRTSLRHLTDRHRTACPFCSSNKPPYQ